MKILNLYFSEAAMATSYLSPPSVPSSEATETGSAGGGGGLGGGEQGMNLAAPASQGGGYTSSAVVNSLQREQVVQDQIS